jgi:spore maturation protein CgeB
VEQVSRHLYCDMSRRAIADRGYGKVTRGAHTYRDRLMTLLGIVASL